MFRPRQQSSTAARILNWIWPRIGIRRAWEYRMLKLSRLRVSSHTLSLGFAAGAFASFTPFIGFHFLIAALIALAVRGNVVASAVGTVVGNPLTFPAIWLATYELGSALVGGGAAGTAAAASPEGAMSALMTGTLSEAWNIAGPVLWPMLVGAVPLGLAGGAASYALVYLSMCRMRARPIFRLRSLAVPGRE